MRSAIPEELRRFILTSVPSVPFVEAMLLFREAGNQPLDTEVIARRLYISQAATREIVAQLQAARIVQPVDVRSGSYAYRPETAELGGLLEMLASCYCTHLVEVTDVIHSKFARTAHQFADAFKLKKDP